MLNCSTLDSFLQYITAISRIGFLIGDIILYAILQEYVLSESKPTEIDIPEDITITDDSIRKDASTFTLTVKTYSCI